MNKSKLEEGKKYLHVRNTEINGIQRTAKRWIKCEEITKTGAIFSRIFEPDIELTDKQIQDELQEGWEK